MIKFSISGNSLKKALKDVQKQTRRKSLQQNRKLKRKASRRFRAAAKSAARDLAKPVARTTGLSIAQAKRRVRSSKKVSGSKPLRSEVFTRGRAQSVHLGRLRGLRVTKRGLKYKGKLLRGHFITKETLRGKKEHRRVLVRGRKMLRAATETRNIPRVYRRAGPVILRRHSRKLAIALAKLVSKA